MISYPNGRTVEDDLVYKIKINPLDHEDSIMVYRTDEWELHDTVIKIAHNDTDNKKLTIIPLFGIKKVEIEVEDNDDE